MARGFFVSALAAVAHNTFPEAAAGPTVLIARSTPAFARWWSKWMSADLRTQRARVF